jgi:hypothetical protein
MSSLACVSSFACRGWVSLHVFCYLIYKAVCSKLSWQGVHVAAVGNVVRSTHRACHALLANCLGATFTGVVWQPFSVLLPGGSFVGGLGLHARWPAVCALALACVYRVSVALV